MQQETEADSRRSRSCADQRREGEEEQGDLGDEDLERSAGEDRGHRVLHEGKLLSRRCHCQRPEEVNHERGQRADHHGVDEDREHLDEALLMGCDTEAEAAVFERSRRPPRFRVEAALTGRPAKPPKIALKSKAPAKIAENIVRSSCEVTISCRRPGR